MPTAVQELTEAIESLNALSREPASDDLEKSAATETSRILDALSRSSSPETNLLALFANVLSKFPSSEILGANFAHLAFLHLFHPGLHPMLFKILSTQDSNAQNAYGLPMWWPSLPGSAPDILSPFHYQFELASFSEAHKDQLEPVLAVVIQTKSIFDKIISETEPNWKTLRDLGYIMGQSKGQCDLTRLLILQNEGAVSHLHRSSVQTTCQTSQKIAKLIIEQLLVQKSLVFSLALIDGLSGAKRLLPLYPSQQHSAPELAANDCFRFILDFLNQTAGGTFVTTPTTLTCIPVASYKLAVLCSSTDLAMLYDSFNKRSNVHSLLTVCTQFGCDIAQCFLSISGSNYDLSSFLPAVKKFSGKALPPLPKLNYFVLDKKYPGSSEVSATSTLEDLNGLHASLYYLLKAVASLLKGEFQQALNIQSTALVLQKILVNKVQHLLSFLLAALICNRKNDSTELSYRYTEKVAFEIIGKLFEGMDAAQTSLVWVTLFNFANDVCYVEVSLVENMRDFLKTIVAKFSTEEQEFLINSGIKDFDETFEEPILHEFASAASFHENDAGDWKALPRNEYSFLYSTVPKTRKEDDSNSKSFGQSQGRQQSVHIDKFGRD